ncbi:MAG: hypothetical protein Q7R96_00030 [Nanoarchaeota archaeon]|nr:hypothetical protein [Nanoarchaeota archaeon]
MQKKGAIWVASVLYLAVGLVALGLLLTAALPAINKLKDRNTVAQTKQLFYTLDEYLRTVVVEGVASQRELNPLTINKGIFTINETNIHWQLPTEALIIEPSTPEEKIIKKEGNLELWEEKTPTVGNYLMHLDLHYETIGLYVNPDSAGMPLLGTYRLLFKNWGASEDRVIVNVSIQ